jgi:hypothetical protein
MLFLSDGRGGAVPAVLDIMMDFALKLRKIIIYIYIYNPAGFRRKLLTLTREGVVGVPAPTEPWRFFSSGFF